MLAADKTLSFRETQNGLPIDKKTIIADIFK